ncbi:MAG: MBL fold metallo-hydrolase [Clostridia bacterium]|nr:MBL fold metallo-hydrolase [Clostridia bacterium]
MDITPVLCGMIGENAYIAGAEGRRDCVVVDPGDEPEKIEQALGDRRPGAILLTHGHFDHIMAVQPLAERFCAPVYLAEADLEMLNDPGKNGYEALTGRRQAAWPPVNAVPFPDTLEVAGMTFQVLPTPGHSRGSVCLYLKDEGLLFSGDTLFRAGYGRMDLYGGDLQAMIASLRFLFALPPETRVFPGHGEETTIGAEKARYRL